MASNGVTLSAYEPSLRDKFAWFFGDMFPDEPGMRWWAQRSARNIADVIPGVGDAVGIDETKRAVERGDYADAAVQGVGTAVGAFPGAGDLLAAGVKSVGPGLAMFLGPKALGADLSALRAAKGMKNAGATPYEIVTDTGWRQGVDTKWRYEIPDDRARLHGPTSHGMEDEPLTTQNLSDNILDPDILGNVFSHPELFKAYPGIENYAITQVPIGAGMMGSFGEIPRDVRKMVDGGLPKYGLTLDVSPENADPTGILLHELQHAVQQIEKFDEGSSPDHVLGLMGQGFFGNKRDIADRMRPYVSRAINEGYDPKTAADKAVWDIYRRNSGEHEANVVTARRQMTPVQRRQYPFGGYEFAPDELWWLKDPNMQIPRLK